MKVKLLVTLKDCDRNKIYHKGSIFDFKKETDLFYYFWLKNGESEWLPKQMVEILNV